MAYSRWRQERQEKKTKREKTQREKLKMSCLFTILTILRNRKVTERRTILRKARHLRTFGAVTDADVILKNRTLMSSDKNEC